METCNLLTWTHLIEYNQSMLWQYYFINIYVDNVLADVQLVDNTLLIHHINKSYAQGDSEVWSLTYPLDAGRKGLCETKLDYMENTEDRDCARLNYRVAVLQQLTILL